MRTVINWRYGLRRIDGEFQVVEVYQSDDSGDEWLTQTQGLGYCDPWFTAGTPEKVVAMLENAIRDIKRERGLE